jgi:hypothetical protein
MNERNFLDHYFLSVYNKLEADAVLFNRRLPHAGLAGSENELALSTLIRDFLPSRFGVETSGIVIDRFGNESRQCDIIIYDDWNFPTYFRKVFPVELVYGVIEVKTNLTSTEASNALENLKSLSALESQPLLTPYWQTRSAAEQIQSNPPFGMIFAYRSDATKNFETFANWFPLKSVHDIYKPKSDGSLQLCTLTIAALDQGIIKMESSNLYVERWVPIAAEDAITRSFVTGVRGAETQVDPVKVLLIFLETLWQRLWQHRLHPGFDIRTYMTEAMSTIIDMGGVSEPPSEA